MPDADRWLDIFGVGLVLAIVVGMVVVGLSFAGTGGDGAPDAEWTIERVDDTHVRITHAGGEPVRAENVRVTVDRLRRVTNWSDPISEGDTVTVDAVNGTVVRVIWTGGRGDRTVMASKRL